MATHTYPPVSYPLPPPTTNALSREDRAQLVRSSKKLGRVLGDTPRFLDSDAADASDPYLRSDVIGGVRPSTPSGVSLRTMDSRTSTLSQNQQATSHDSTRGRRKHKHLPPMLKLAFTNTDSSQPKTAMAIAADSPLPMPSTGPSGSNLPLRSAPARKTSHSARYSPIASTFNNPNSASERRSKLERLRRKLGDEVPAEAVFPSTPTTATPRPHRKSHTRSHTMTQGALAMHGDSSESIVFSISSSNSGGDSRDQQHTVVLKTSTRTNKYHHSSQNAPPVPTLPPNSYPHKAYRPSANRSAPVDDDEMGLVKPRVKASAGSKLGSQDYVAHRRAKKEGRGGMESIEMVGFMGGGMGGF
ncbi:hypothetical protein BJ138DRAFT_56539 [Hygrophoropsis aurantiaca]|uniref:Uncharacterized protein n=1 Tax=Hygrophoropsis aurantiaca TaxID=72124 RepID=A0ACB8AQP4_9AGAM|nr:hypothetical protein BJ138DRAFT_56539 [Hygrophoropsis aurantiaca]